MVVDFKYAEPMMIVFRRGWVNAHSTVNHEFAHIPLMTALAGTSAYFGPLADHRVHRRLRRRLLWLWLYSSPHRSLAPNLGSKLLVDGCLWDTHSLGTALHLVKVLELARAQIFIVVTYPIDVCDWWRPRNTESDPLHEYATGSNFEERAYFDGDCVPQVLYDMGMCKLIVIKECRVRKDNWRSEWAPVGCTVDLIIVILNGVHLNTIVFHSTPQYASYEKKAYMHLRRALARIEISRPSIVALSGGGTRAAIAAHAALRAFSWRGIEPCAIAACSGGAWGVVVHAEAGDTRGLPTMVRHGKILDGSSYAKQAVMALVHDVLGKQWETIMHTVPALRRVDFDWNRFVRTMLFGHSRPTTWTELLAKLPKSVQVLAMPTGYLTDTKL